MTQSRLRAVLEQDLRSNGGVLSVEGVRMLGRSKNSVLLESTLPSANRSRTLIYLEPAEIIRAHRIQEVMPALVRAQVYLEQGFHVAGYVTYEAAPAFLPVPSREPSDVGPSLLWFGVYRDPIDVIRSEERTALEGTGIQLTIGQVHPRVSAALYARAYRTIREYLERGHTYQVNYTFPVDGRWDASPEMLYARLRSNQPVPYAAYLKHDDVSILSFSPELFFEVHGRTITLRPMKGTAARGLYDEDDEAARLRLERSAKDRAENRMIVDLLRNDVGRLAAPGSVRVQSFFDIERYPTVFQATSTITARTKERLALVDAFRCLFPCGSVTGAPKIETMKIINELERYPRGVYTGAIGHAAPDGSMTFSVAIRTAIADAARGSFRIDVGSGVTMGSDAKEEYQECLQKASFVEREAVRFDLFETILWRASKGYWLLRGHLRRLSRSAQYFDRPFDRALIIRHLKALAVELERQGVDCRVRLALDAFGQVSTSWHALEQLPPEPRVGFSNKRIRSDDRFQYHKTTRRETYDAVLEAARARGWFDAIVLNERGEVAEGSRSNIVIERAGTLVTPPRSAGLLAGVAREHFMRTRNISERSLTRKDVLVADRVYVTNAVRGMIEVRVVGS